MASSFSGGTALSFSRGSERCQVYAAEIQPPSNNAHSSRNGEAPCSFARQINPTTLVASQKIDKHSLKNQR
jgi:hypothetical protein